jgi:hypothetical protein
MEVEMKRFAVALAVLALVAPMVLGLHPSPASAKAPAATIHVLTAKLVTGGVDVTVSYSCPPPSPGLVQVTVNHPTGSGMNTADAICDGHTHKATILVTGPFVKGTATINAFVQNGDSSAANGTDVEANIT